MISENERYELEQSERDKKFPIIKIQRKLHQRRQLNKGHKQQKKWMLIVSNLIRNIATKLDGMNIPKEIQHIIFEFVKIEPLTVSPRLGDRVTTKKGRTGTVRYVGSVDFSSAELIGLELDSWTANGHNGTVRGKTYFRCAPGYGYFTRLFSLVMNNGQTYSRNDTETIDSEKMGHAEDIQKVKSKLRKIEILEFKLSNGVKLNRGATDLISSKQQLLKELNDLNVSLLL